MREEEESHLFKTTRVYSNAGYTPNLTPAGRAEGLRIDFLSQKEPA
jgi:hypothetical protein